jgi:TAP C-terminal domain
MNTTKRRNQQAKRKSVRAAFAARHEAMVRRFATQFSVNQKDARKYLEGADWNYARAFDALLVSMRTVDEADKTARALAAILTPPTAAEIQRHAELGDRTADFECRRRTSEGH